MGQLDALYVSAWLQVRPQAFSAAVGSMPKYCQVDTLEEPVAAEETFSTKDSNNSKSNSSKKRASDAETVIAFLESRFGSTEAKMQLKEQAMQSNKRARTFIELEQLTKSLCAAVQAGLGSTVVGCLEANVEEYVKKVEEMDASGKH